MLNDVLVNVGARMREFRLAYRDMLGVVYPTVTHKRDRWATVPHKRDSVSRLLRYRARWAADRERVR